MTRDPIERLVRKLAAGLRARVLPLTGAHAARAHVENATSAGGDVTFTIDELAERHLEEFIAREAPRYAFYSEDRGLVEPTGAADWVLVVDPVDGTRPALAGLESACTSVAVAPYRDDVTMGDVQAGCIVEIKSGVTFYAKRGTGVDVRCPEGGTIPVQLSENIDLTRLFWTFGFRGRPARPLVEVLGNLIDASSVGGAAFDLGSACFDMTRIVTGQLDAYLDIGTHMIDEVPALKGEFERLGSGAVLNNSPYDLAAAALCLHEAGAVVTDALGNSLDDRPLLGTGHDFQMSCVAAANWPLHDQLLAATSDGIHSLKRRFV